MGDHIKLGEGPGRHFAERGKIVERLTPMRDRRIVAIEALRLALQREPGELVLQSAPGLPSVAITVAELAALAASTLDQCPLCEAFAFVNIDCDLCLIAGSLLAGEMP